MDVTKMLEELRAERQHLDEAILVLERLAAGSGKRRRGRPPAWLKAAGSVEEAPKPKKRSLGRKKKAPSEAGG